MANGDDGAGARLQQVPWQIMAFAATIIAQTWWIGSKIGTMDSEITNLERRTSIIESTGSPQLGAIKTDLAINGRRVQILEETFGQKIPEAVATNARQDERIASTMRDIESLKKSIADNTSFLQEALLRQRDLVSQMAILKEQVQRLQDAHMSKGG